MKAKKFVVMILAIAAAVMVLGAATQPADAQVVRVHRDIYQGKRLALGTADSTMTDNSGRALNMVYDGNTYPDLTGQWPDSIRIGWYASNDTLVDVHVRVKFKYGYAPTAAATSVLLDSVKSTTVTYVQFGRTIAATSIVNYDQMGIALYAQSFFRTNATLAAQASKITLWADFFYKRSGRQ